MNDPKDIFKTRLTDAWAKGLRYFMLIAGSGSVPVLLLLIASVYTYGYIALLNVLPEGLPTVILLSVVTAVALTVGSLRTFVRPADLVFLAPFAGEMHRYMRLSLLYSGAWHVIGVTAAMFGLYPVVMFRLGGNVYFLFVLFIAILLKMWNVYARWQELNIQRRPGLHQSFRFSVNLLLAFMLFYGGNPFLYAAIASVGLMMITVYYGRFRSRNFFPWYRFVAIEQKKIASLYKIVAFFTDIPQNVQPVKRRPWVSVLFTQLKVSRAHASAYLYSRTFLRSGEHFGIYVRLTLMTGIALFFVENAYATLALYVSGCLLTGIQLPSIWHMHRHTNWLNVYPIPRNKDMTDFVRLVFILLTIQSGLAVVGRLTRGEIVQTLLFLCVGIAFSYWFSFKYLRRKLQRIDE